MKTLTKSIITGSAALGLFCQGANDTAAAPTGAWATPAEVKATATPVKLAADSAPALPLTNQGLGTTVSLLAPSPTDSIPTPLQTLDTKLAWPQEKRLPGLPNLPPGEPTNVPPAPPAQAEFRGIKPVSADPPDSPPQSWAKLNVNQYPAIARMTRVPSQALRNVNGLRTQAWTTLVGWHPGGPTLLDPSIYNPDANPFFLGGEQQ